MVFLCETRQEEEKMRRLRGGLGLKGFTSVDSNGLSRGLALFWHENLLVDILDKDTIDTSMWWFVYMLTPNHGG